MKFRVNPLKFSLIWRDLVLAILEVLPLLPEPVALEVLPPSLSISRLGDSCGYPIFLYFQ